MVQRETQSVTAVLLPRPSSAVDLLHFKGSSSSPLFPSAGHGDCLNVVFTLQFKDLEATVFVNT